MKPSSRWSRTTTLLAGGAALSLVFLGLLKTAVLGHPATVAVDDYATVVAPAAAALACWRAARRAEHHAARSENRTARAWLLMCLSLLASAAGGMVWTVYEVHLRREVPYPGWADVGYLLAVPLAVASLLCFPTARAGAARIRTLLDGVIAAGALLFASWATVLGPALRDGSGSIVSQTVSLAYPATDVLTVTVALLILARAPRPQRVTMSMISLGLVFISLSDTAFTWLFAHDALTTGSLFDTGYVAGYLLIGIAALRTDPTPAEAHVERPGRVAQSLPYAPLLVSLPFAVGLQIQGRPLGPFLFYVSLLIILAILARQLLSMQVNSALTGELTQTVASLRHREVELHHQAFHDPLTGLANRALFADRINHALARTRQAGPVIVLLADLDDFKNVNDTLGHSAGDALLVSVAGRLRSVVRPEDTVARLGGDEFAVLLEAADGLTDAREIAERIGRTLVRPFLIAGQHTVIGASIGISVASPSATGEALLREADIAMYAAKADGKGGYTVYALELAAANIGRMRLQADLAEALDRDELSLKYQPIVDVDTGRLLGVEALLRWTHPTRGAISPAEFIPLAEASGAIRPIGRWVVAQACAQMGRWQAQRPTGAAPLGLAVNVSGRQLSDPALISAIRAALTAAHLPAAQLTLEITESILLVDDDANLARLLALRELGVRLAIDDFGTGHSSLSRLRRYPVDVLKIDQSFIAALVPGSDEPDVLVGAILALGTGLDLQIIAEGVETDDQLRALRAMGCPGAQGYLFARPVEPGIITDLLSADAALVEPEVSAAGPAERVSS